jgi:hypothetical protein
MSDGRQIINETYKIIKEVSEELEGQKDNRFEDLKKDVGVCLKWAQKCQNKVWLRSKEGTDLAQGCRDEAEKLKKHLTDASVAPEAALDLSMQLESLAKIIASKATVLT